MYTIISFSPTGNTTYIAELLAKQLEVKEVLALEHVKPKALEKDEHLVLLFAIHAFNAPRTVKRFVNNLPKGLYKHISLIGVGCNTTWINHGASKDIKRSLENKSYNIVVDEVMAMPLTLVMHFPDELIQEQLEDADKDVNRISTMIKELKVSKRDIALKSHVINFVGGAESGAARMFGLELHANSDCIKCGLCVEECPEKNISMTEEEKIKFGFKCSMCMRCIYNCPTKAISPYVSRFLPLKGGYNIKDYIDK